MKSLVKTPSVVVRSRRCRIRLGRVGRAGLNRIRHDALYSRLPRKAERDLAAQRIVKDPPVDTIDYRVCSGCDRIVSKQEALLAHADRSRGYLQSDPVGFSLGLGRDIAAGPLPGNDVVFVDADSIDLVEVSEGQIRVLVKVNERRVHTPALVVVSVDWRAGELEVDQELFAVTSAVLVGARVDRNRGIEIPVAIKIVRYHSARVGVDQRIFAQSFGGSRRCHR